MKGTLIYHSVEILALVRDPVAYVLVILQVPVFTVIVAIWLFPT